MKKLFERLMDRFYAWWIGSNVPEEKVQASVPYPYYMDEPVLSTPTDKAPPPDKEPELVPSPPPRKEAVPAPDGPIPLHFVAHNDVPKWVMEYEKEDKPTYAYYYAPNGKGGSFKRFAFSGGHRTGGFGYKTMDDLIDAAHKPWED